MQSQTQEIEVVTLVSGRVRDRATALDPESAIRTAQILAHDAETAGCAASRVETNFYVNGRLAATRKGSL